MANKVDKDDLLLNDLERMEKITAELWKATGIFSINSKRYFVHMIRGKLFGNTKRIFKKNLEK